MALKASKLIVLAILVLSAGLLLSGCAEKNQAVSEEVKRPGFSGAGSSSVSGNTAGSTGENKVSIPVAPAAPAASTGTGGIKDNREKETEDAQVKPETAQDKQDTQQEKPENVQDTPEADSREKTAAAEGEKSGINEAPADNRASQDFRDNSGGEVAQKNGGGNKETPEESVAPGSENGQPVEIKFSEMYSGSSSRGLKFSEKLTALNGKKVVITGYMAPPLKPSFTFFVLTRQPMAICPFCSSDASWPEDILLVYLPKGESRTPTESILTVTGTLELGSHTDPDTGFVSQARIYPDTIKVVR